MTIETRKLVDSVTVQWEDQPSGDDYTAAYNYLTLLTTPKGATTVVNKLRKAPMDTRMAKDVLRASNLPAVDEDNPHVKKHLKELDKGDKLHPVLLVVSIPELYTALTVADGYYATSTAYAIDNTSEVPCKIVTFDATKDL